VHEVGGKAVYVGYALLKLIGESRQGARKVAYLVLALKAGEAPAQAA
jgi:hypothetical protein